MPTTPLHAPSFALLATASFRLSPDLEKAKVFADAFVYSNRYLKTYLLVSPQQHDILQRFQLPTRLDQLLPKLVGDRKCIPLAEMYELILKAVDAGVLVADERTRGVLNVRMPWPALNLGFGRMVSAGLAILSVLVYIIRYPQWIPDKWTWVDEPKDWGILALVWFVSCIALTAGTFFAGMIVRGSGGEVFGPMRMKWLCPFPHLTVDLSDVIMGGRETIKAARFMQISVLCGAMGLLCWFLPFAGFAGVWVVLLAMAPLPTTLAHELLKAMKSKAALSTASNFLLPVNQVLTTSMWLRWKSADREYVLRWIGYAFSWLFVVFIFNECVFHSGFAEIWSDFLWFGNAVVLASPFILGIALVAVALIFWVSRRRRLALHQADLDARARFTEASRFIPDAEPNQEMICQFLAHHTLLFDGCKLDTLKAAAAAMELVPIEARQRIQQEGSTGDKLHIVYSGRCEVFQLRKDGSLQHLAELKPGDMFGADPLVSGETHSYSVCTLEPTRVLSLPYEVFNSALRSVIGDRRIQDVVAKESFLYHLKLCEQWGPAAIRKFAEQATVVRLGKGDSLVNSGKDNQFFHIVKTGGFNVRINDKTVARLMPGDFFGEISLLQSNLPKADVIAFEDSYVLSIHRGHFLAFLGENPVIALQIEEVASKRLKAPVFGPRKAR